MRGMSISRLLSVLISLGILIAAVYSIGGYYLLKKATEKSIEMESLNRTFYVNKEMAGLYNRISDAYESREVEMYEALRYAQRYFKSHGREASLESLKQRLISDHNESIYEVFQINEAYVIDRTTYPNDLGLDFKHWQSPYRLLQDIYDHPGKIDLSMIIHSASYVDMRRFIVQRAEDDSYLIQLGLTLERDYLQQKSIISLQEKIPTLINTRVYQVFGSPRAPKDVERWWMMEIHEHTGNPQMLQDDVSDEFQKIIISMIPSPQSFINRKARQKYYIDLFKEHHYLDSYFYKEERYIHRIVMPLSSRFTLYNESVSLIVMDFDESVGQERLMMMNIMVTLLWAFLLLLTLIAVWLVRSRIIIPLFMMQSQMRMSESVSLSTLPNSDDEVGSISRAYNHLLEDLHREISSNKALLQEFKLFAGNAIHQIRTPLSVIKIALEMMESKNREAEQQIRSSLVSIEHMYDALSYVVQHDKVVYIPEKIDFSELFEMRIKVFTVVAEAHDMRFDIHIEPDLYVSMSRQEAEYLIDNNLSNVIKFSRAGSMMTLSLRRIKSEIMLSFWSYGEMIEDSRLIFKRYFREDKCKRGSGIGLNMVDTICRRYNIMIEVEYLDEQNRFTYYIEAM